MAKEIKLSIIIPCYNCEKTLLEAVESCYTQNIENFEIIMVDDYSKDNTRVVMQKLADIHPEIKLFYNQKNMGGGATRNVAVRNSSAEIIFCLDSDDILGKSSLNKMLELIKRKKCDGVSLGKSIKFKKNNTNRISYIDDFNKYSKEPIPLRSMFEKDVCPLTLVFMFTKKAFNVVGGYPEKHGFDTQGFGFRFLVKGLKAYACPDSIYYHRINFHKSYYLREYESGKINHNWYHLLEEFLYIFDDNVKKIVLEFNLNSRTKILFDEMRKEAIKIKNYNSKPKIDTKNIYDKYWIAWNFYQEKEYFKSQKIFEDITEEIPNNLYSHYYLEKCVIQTGIKSEKIDKEKIRKIFLFEKQGTRVNILVRIFRKILRFIKNN